jgi:prevent-host-death family protein
MEARVYTVNIHEAKTHLSRLIEQAVNGEPFVIAKAGKPMVTVTAYSTPEVAPVKRLGFLAGEISVPDDFDEIGAQEIAQLFGGNP